MLAVALLVLNAATPMASAAERCQVPAGFVPLGRIESNGIVALFRTLPPVIELGRHFSVDAIVCDDAGAAALTRWELSFDVDAAGQRTRLATDLNVE